MLASQKEEKKLQWDIEEQKLNGIAEELWKHFAERDFKRLDNEISTLKQRHETLKNRWFVKKERQEITDQISYKENEKKHLIDLFKISLVNQIDFSLKNHLNSNVKKYTSNEYQINAIELNSENKDSVKVALQDSENKEPFNIEIPYSKGSDNKKEKSDKEESDIPLSLDKTTLSLNNIKFNLLKTKQLVMQDFKIHVQEFLKEKKAKPSWWQWKIKKKFSELQAPITDNAEIFRKLELLIEIKNSDKKLKEVCDQAEKELINKSPHGDLLQLYITLYELEEKPKGKNKQQIGDDNNLVKEAKKLIKEFFNGVVQSRWSIIEKINKIKRDLTDETKQLKLITALKIPQQSFKDALKNAISGQPTFLQTFEEITISDTDELKLLFGEIDTITSENNYLDNVTNFVNDTLQDLSITQRQLYLDRFDAVFGKIDVALKNDSKLKQLQKEEFEQIEKLQNALKAQRANLEISKKELRGKQYPIITALENLGEQLFFKDEEVKAKAAATIVALLNNKPFELSNGLTIKSYEELVEQAKLEHLTEQSIHELVSFGILQHLMHLTTLQPNLSFDQIKKTNDEIERVLNLANSHKINLVALSITQNPLIKEKGHEEIINLLQQQAENFEVQEAINLLQQKSVKNVEEAIKLLQPAENFKEAIKFLKQYCVKFKVEEAINLLAPLCKKFIEQFVATIVNLKQLDTLKDLYNMESHFIKLFEQWKFKLNENLPLPQNIIIKDGKISEISEEDKNKINVEDIKKAQTIYDFQFFVSSKLLDIIKLLSKNITISDEDFVALFNHPLLDLAKNILNSNNVIWWNDENIVDESLIIRHTFNVKFAKDIKYWNESIEKKDCKNIFNELVQKLNVKFIHQCNALLSKTKRNEFVTLLNAAANATNLNPFEAQVLTELAKALCPIIRTPNHDFEIIERLNMIHDNLSDEEISKFVDQNPLFKDSLQLILQEKQQDFQVTMMELKKQQEEIRKKNEEQTKKKDEEAKRLQEAEEARKREEEQKKAEEARQQEEKRKTEEAKKLEEEKKLEQERKKPQEIEEAKKLKKKKEATQELQMETSDSDDIKASTKNESKLKKTKSVVKVVKELDPIDEIKIKYSKDFGIDVGIQDLLGIAPQKNEFATAALLRFTKEFLIQNFSILKTQENQKYYAIRDFFSGVIKNISKFENIEEKRELCEIILDYLKNAPVIENIRNVLSIKKNTSSKYDAQFLVDLLSSITKTEAVLINKELDLNPAKIEMMKVIVESYNDSSIPDDSTKEKIEDYSRKILGISEEIKQMFSDVIPQKEESAESLLVSYIKRALESELPNLLKNNERNKNAIKRLCQCAINHKKFKNEEKQLLWKNILNYLENAPVIEKGKLGGLSKQSKDSKYNKYDPEFLVDLTCWITGKTQEEVFSSTNQLDLNPAKERGVNEILTTFSPNDYSNEETKVFLRKQSGISVEIEQMFSTVKLEKGESVESALIKYTKQALTVGSNLSTLLKNNDRNKNAIRRLFECALKHEKFTNEEKQQLWKNILNYLENAPIDNNRKFFDGDSKYNEYDLNFLIDLASLITNEKQENIFSSNKLNLTSAKDKVVEEILKTFSPQDSSKEEVKVFLRKKIGISNEIELLFGVELVKEDSVETSLIKYINGALKNDLPTLLKNNERNYIAIKQLFESALKHEKFTNEEKRQLWENILNYLENAPIIQKGKIGGLSKQSKDSKYDKYDPKFLVDLVCLVAGQSEDMVLSNKQLNLNAAKAKAIIAITDTYITTSEKEESIPEEGKEKIKELLRKLLPYDNENEKEILGAIDHLLSKLNISRDQYYQDEFEQLLDPKLINKDPLNEEQIKHLKIVTAYLCEKTGWNKDNYKTLFVDNKELSKEQSAFFNFIIDKINAFRGDETPPDKSYQQSVLKALEEVDSLLPLKKGERAGHVVTELRKAEELQKQPSKSTVSLFGRRGSKKPNEEGNENQENQKEQKKTDQVENETPPQSPQVLKNEKTGLFEKTKPENDMKGKVADEDEGEIKKESKLSRVTSFLRRRG